MTTLLGVYDGKGRCVGTCDARCYNARIRPGTALRCLCICGGVNHGIGEDAAREGVGLGVGRHARDIELFASVHEFLLDELIVCDRTRVPDARRASRWAENELWLRRHQLELPFEAGATHALKVTP